VNQRKQRGQSKLDSQFPALATASTRAICFEANFKLFIRDFRIQTQTDFRKKMPTWQHVAAALTATAALTAMVFWVYDETMIDAYTEVRADLSDCATSSAASVWQRSNFKNFKNFKNIFQFKCHHAPHGPHQSVAVACTAQPSRHSSACRGTLRLHTPHSRSDSNCMRHDASKSTHIQSL
jgi:hypothetical protein